MVPHLYSTFHPYLFTFRRVIIVMPFKSDCNKDFLSLKITETKVEPDERVRRQSDRDGRPTGSSSHSTE